LGAEPDRELPELGGRGLRQRNLGTAAFDPGTPAAGTFYYFVIVGNNGTIEGSYGQDSAGIERPEAGTLPGCSYPQQLIDACP